MNRSVQSTAVDELRRAADYLSQRRLSEALAAFDKAELLGCDRDQCAAGRWDCWMLLGKFEEAWRESDQISSRGMPDPNALWDGLPFTGKRLIIRCLHGYGDTMQFLRYAAMIRPAARQVIVETHPEMVSLLSGQPCIDKVTTWADDNCPKAADWDQQIEITELPRVFRTTLSTIPASVPYLHVSPEAQHRSDRQLGSSKRLKIGLVWASSMWNPARSIRLRQLLPALNRNRFAFYSFQRGPERAELNEFAETFDIHDTSRHSPEIADTAADLMNMDLLITVDTMAAHLAGALGKTVWTLLPWAADWRWMVEREDSPWYPTMRLFRQSPAADWESVVHRVAAELDRFRV